MKLLFIGNTLITLKCINYFDGNLVVQAQMQTSEARLHPQSKKKIEKEVFLNIIKHSYINTIIKNNPIYFK